MSAAPSKAPVAPQAGGGQRWTVEGAGREPRVGPAVGTAGCLVPVVPVVFLVVPVVPPPGTVVAVEPVPEVVVPPPDTAVVLVVPEVPTGAAHTALEMVLRSRVTAALRASVLPLIAAPVVTVMAWRASTAPTKFEFVPSVAELPICQTTLQACAPPIRFTRLPDAVVRVELGVWKMNTAFGSPAPSRVRVPVSWSEGLPYRPREGGSGRRGQPRRYLCSSAGGVVVGGDQVRLRLSGRGIGGVGRPVHGSRGTP